MKIIIRWWDGYLQVVDNVKDWRAGAYLLWIEYTDGHTRHVPLFQVRWFEPIPSDKEYLKSRVDEEETEEG
jgi:hypothetical protein